MNTNMLIAFTQSLGYVGVVTVFLFVAKILSDKMMNKRFTSAAISDSQSVVDYMIEEDNNNAIAFRRGGMYLGIAIGMFGALQGASKGFINDITLLCIDGTFLLIFMMLSRVVNNWFIINGIDNDTAIKDGNNAVGLVEAGGYIATGIIVYASISGDGGPWGSAIVYFILGQIALIGITMLYEMITPYNVVQNIREGNVAAGTMCASMLIAFSLILKGAIAGPFTGWVADITSFSISTIAGLLMVLLLFNKVIDTFFLAGTDIKTEIERDKNVAAIIVVSAVKIAMAFIISAVLI